MRIFKRSIAETKRLINVASGRRAADFYLANGKIVNVYSGELIEGNVATSGERIASGRSFGRHGGTADESAGRWAFSHLRPSSR
jgi:adenine deaminase